MSVKQNIELHVIFVHDYGLESASFFNRREWSKHIFVHLRSLASDERDHTAKFLTEELEKNQFSVGVEWVTPSHAVGSRKLNINENRRSDHVYIKKAVPQ